MTLYNPDYDTCRMSDVIGRSMLRNMAGMITLLRDRVPHLKQYRDNAHVRLRDNVGKQIEACEEANRMIFAWQERQISEGFFAPDIAVLVNDLQSQGFVMRNEIYQAACKVLQVPIDLRAIIAAR